MDNSKLELLKNKEEHAQSAVASQEVKEHLAGFLRQKRQGSSSQTSTESHQTGQDQSGNQCQCTSNNNNPSTSRHDDHPLRKTASMPIMHIPYKAQSLSRRRQMERRTTMSPLMKRKSRPKRQLLHSLDSNSSECSSNPCIINSSQPNTRSHSQSSTPPPEQVDDIAYSIGFEKPMIQSEPSSNQQSTQATPKQTNTKPPQPIELNHIYTNSELENLQNTSMYFQNPNNTQQMQSQASINNPLYDNALQMHLKVNEAIKRTVIQRASSKGRMNTGGSLDIEPTASRRGNLVRSGIAPAFGDEPRQYSLDAVDLKSFQMSSGKYLSNVGSGAFYREFPKHRLATTNDAASLRRSQSPNSSISMGMSGSPVGNPIHIRDARVSMIACAHGKQYSSSSSSTSSLLSQQDSLEDSSTQAIDLRSNSEASRLRQHQQNNSHLHGPSTSLGSQTANQIGFQAIQDGMKDLFLASTNTPTPPQQTKSSTCCISQKNPSPLARSSTMTSSPESNNLQAHQLMNDQFNLSSSTKNLISQHRQLANNAIGMTNLFDQDLQGVMDIDPNQLLIAYRNQMSNNILANLPESCRSDMLNHLKHCSVNQVLSTDSAHIKTGSRSHTQDDTKAIIARALSSPLLNSKHADSGKSNELPRNIVKHGNQDNELQQLAHYNNRQKQQKYNCDVINRSVLGRFQFLDEAPQDAGINMIIDMNEPSIGSQTDSSSSNKHVEAGYNHSLDLTTSSSRSSGQTRTTSDIVEREPPLNYCSMIRDLRKVDCSYIYNPVFKKDSKTGLVYDLEMCNHKCICANESNHPENSYRVLSIWRRLYDRGLMAKCAQIEARKATLDELQLVHSETYCCYFGKSPYERIKMSHLDLSKLPIKGLTQLECGGQGADIDTAWNEELTPNVARLATGCVLEAVTQVAKGKLMNAFAIVRPPGHLAEYHQAMGFCFFNSVAIATRVLIEKLQFGRVLIVDWDVHHANGLQRVFYEDNDVLCVSLHRHDEGNFFPGTGDIQEIGSGQGEGYNWNIAWSNEVMGDAEYMAAFRTLVMPMAQDFNPSMVLVACGFDAARGHSFNFGGYKVSPGCFGYLTRQLMTLAHGRIVLCLEGGYDLNSICDCAESCVRALLNESQMLDIDRVSEYELKRSPNYSACSVMLEVSSLAAKYWPSIAQNRKSIGLSEYEASNLS